MAKHSLEDEIKTILDAALRQATAAGRVVTVDPASDPPVVAVAVAADKIGDYLAPVVAGLREAAIRIAQEVDQLKNA